MIFTREDILKIQNALLQLGRKDSEFKDANTPLNSNDEIAILQDGINKKVSINNLLSTLGLLKKDDFINVSDRYDEYYIQLSEAITIIANNKRKKGLVITFQDLQGDWKIFQFAGELNNFSNTNYWKDLFDFKYPIVNSILPDEEDLTLTLPNEDNNSFIKLKDKEYDTTNFSGMGTKIIRKNIIEITQDDGTIKRINYLSPDIFNSENTIYVIKHDFTLNEDITIPDNCVLKFDGGSISGAHTLTGTNTVISETINKIFGIDITIEGTFITSLICPEMFGAKGDGTTDDSDAIQAAELLTRCTIEKRIPAYSIKQYHNTLTLLNRKYGIGKTIYISSDISIVGNGAAIVPLNGGIFNVFENRNYMIVSKNIIPKGDVQRVVWENFSLNKYSYENPISGIYFAAQGYIRRIQTYGMDCAIYIADEYKDFVEIDGIYLMDGDPNVWKIHGGYLGDARNFKNIWCSTEKALQVGKAHFSCSVDHMVTGSLEIEQSDTYVTNCMFNSSEISKVYIGGGAKVVFTNCYFGITGDSKITITDGPYSWRKSKVTFISCTFNYNAPYLLEDFEDNIINCPDTNTNITFIDTFFNDQDKISQANMYKHAPHIKGLDGLNTYIGIGLNNTNKTLPNIKINCSTQVRSRTIKTSSQTLNLLGTTETWNYTITVIYDIKRQLIGNTITGSVDAIPEEGGFIRLGFSETNIPPALYIKKTRGNITEYAVVPMCTFDPSFYDTGITVAGRKWITGDILDITYEINPTNITYCGIEPNNIEPINVEIVTTLTLDQFNNKIRNNNVSNWKAGDIVELKDGTKLIKKIDKNWYTINETILS